MPIKIDVSVTPARLRARVQRVFELSAGKILALEKAWDPARGTPVFTVKGRYTSRGWTEWTQGFQFGAAFLQFDATGDARFLRLGRERTLEVMASHVSHVGVHDHGFNNISTYGNYLRLSREGRVDATEKEDRFCELALKVSGAVQAARWTATAGGGGYIYSFNGPHSLFIDTMRSLRSLAAAHHLGHVLMGERDVRISLLGRLIEHARATARFALYFGEGRDAYDVRGRTAHESIFNLNDGNYRCPNSQQGYSPFSTWTRGLAWAVLGYAEQLEYLENLKDAEINEATGLAGVREGRGAGRPGAGARGHFRHDAAPIAARAVRDGFIEAARATADHYLEVACADGIPVWDNGAPGLHRMKGYEGRRSDPFNAHEPMDSSAAAIAAQGLLRLARVRGLSAELSRRYRQAALTIAGTLFEEPYLSVDPRHEGLLLHSVYHRPNGWDYIPAGASIPNGESSMWGDYHARELALCLLRELEGREVPRFFDGVRPR